MAGQTSLQPAPSSVSRRQPLLERSSDFSRRRRAAEVAGRTTADCVAVCCCCPCGLVNLLYLAVYKLPASLCRKVLSRARRTQRKCHVHAPSAAFIAPLEFRPENHDEFALEREMLENFHDGGFWRSPSSVAHTPES